VYGYQRALCHHQVFSSWVSTEGKGIGKGTGAAVLSPPMQKCVESDRNEIELRSECAAFIFIKF